jgi:hypothetical protein
VRAELAVVIAAARVLVDVLQVFDCVGSLWLLLFVTGNGIMTANAIWLMGADWSEMGVVTRLRWMTAPLRGRDAFSLFGCVQVRMRFD